MRYLDVVLFVALQVVFSSLPYLETGYLRHTSEKVQHPSISFTCPRAVSLSDVQAGVPILKCYP